MRLAAKKFSNIIIFDSRENFETSKTFLEITGFPER